MAHRHSVRLALGCIAAVIFYLGASGAAATGREESSPALTVTSGRVSLSGTSNIHAYTASTNVVRLTRVQLESGVTDASHWDAVLTPGAVQSFEVVIPAATLASPKGDIDKNMHKALRVVEHPDIVFRLLRLEPGTGAPAALRGVGRLQIAGVERDVALEITTERRDTHLVVRGQLQLLMTDYGVKAPTAMLGMLKTDPKVTVTFETVLATPQS
jgi:polyisoprenoid-binding protein YceI